MDVSKAGYYIEKKMIFFMDQSIPDFLNNISQISLID
jgi:hypothetical protein